MEACKQIFTHADIFLLDLKFFSPSCRKTNAKKQSDNLNRGTIEEEEAMKDRVRGRLENSVDTDRSEESTAQQIRSRRSEGFL